MPISAELQAAIDAPGFGSGRSYRDRKAQEAEAVAMQPDPEKITPVMASTDPVSNWMICGFGASNEDSSEWFLVTDNVRASEVADREFPDDAKIDALRVAAVLNAYRMGLLVVKGEK